MTKLSYVSTQDLIQLKEKGLSYTGIGKVYGVSRQRIHQLIGKFCVHIKPKLKEYTCKHCGCEFTFKNGTGYLESCRNCIDENKIKRKLAWSIKHDKCIMCGTTEHKHRCGGYCTRCGQSHKYATDPKFKESKISRANAWRQDNPEKYKTMTRRASLKYFNKLRVQGLCFKCRGVVTKINPRTKKLCNCCAPCRVLNVANYKKYRKNTKSNFNKV